MANKKKTQRKHEPSKGSENEKIRYYFKTASKERLREANHRKVSNPNRTLDLDDLRQKRRLDAIIHTKKFFMDQLKSLCPNTPEDTLLEIWVSNNADNPVGIDEANSVFNLDHAIAIWILDIMRKLNRTKNATYSLYHVFQKVSPARFTSIVDPCNSEYLTAGILHIVRNRNKDCTAKHIESRPGETEDFKRIFMDDWTAENLHKQDVVSRNDFDTLLEFIPEQYQKDAGEYFMEKLMQWLTCYYHSLSYLLSEQDKVDQQIKRLNAQEQELYKRFFPKNISDIKIPSSPLRHLPDSAMKEMKDLQKQHQILFDKYNSFHFGIQNLNCQNPFFSNSTKETIIQDFGEEVYRYWENFVIEDPYKLIYGFFHLLENGSDIPWLYHPSQNLLFWAANALPWTISNNTEYDCLFDFDCEEEYEAANSTILDMADIVNNYWNDKQYTITDPDTGEEAKLNLAQCVYAMTGGVIPRSFGEITRKLYPLANCKADLDNDLTTVISCAALMYSVCQQRKDLQLISPTTSENDEDNSEEVYEANIAQLKKEIQQLQSSLWEAEHTNRKLNQEIEKSKKAYALEKQELTDLRELIYNQQKETYSEPNDTASSVAFPYTTQHKTVVFGGHESWSREIRQKLPDVKFVDRNTNPNSLLIRNADIVWIQANALSHKNYYSIINEVRKYDIPLRYFTYASATKCAEQLALADKE